MPDPSPKTELSQPSQIAREALRRLAVRRIQPTPDNYKALYHEIACTAAPEAFPDKAMKALAETLPRNTPSQLKFARILDGAIAAQSWPGIREALTAALDGEAGGDQNWAPLIRDLVHQLERRHTGITAAKKRGILEHVLTASGGGADTLYGRLQSLVRSWSQMAHANSAPGCDVTETLPSQPLAELGAAAEPVSDTPAPVPPTTPAPNAELRELIAGLIENTLTLLLSDAPALLREAEQLAAEIRAAQTPAAIDAFKSKLKGFTFRTQWVAEDQTELRAALLHALQLLVENIGEIVIDDRWLHGQVDMLRELCSQPLNLRRLDEVERRLKDVICKQSSLKKSLSEAQERLKSMLAGFVDRLADFSESTTDYHDKIEQCAGRIAAARDIGELSDVVAEVLRETRTIQVSAARSRDELREMRARADDAEKQVAALRAELEQASQLVRHDQLTGALNRKGLDEAVEREVARAQRRDAPLCLALLDIDNFKRLNDTLGHQAGDDALVHLARVMRTALRAQDTVARYGGEEFLVILPDTALPEAVAVMSRLQRELTKNIFMHNNERVLITFSAGVTAFGPEDTRDKAIARADSAMYKAKETGKNRVVAAP